jgi:hypothetical protein
MSGPDSVDDLPRWGTRSTGAALVALCLVTFGLKLLAATPREAVGHGDVAHYFVLARNLIEGRGLWVDYLATWLAAPTSTHTYGAAYWMPMPAWLAVPGMAVRGTDSMRGSCDGLIVLTSLAPLLVFAIGRDVFGSRRAGLLGAVLATGFHLFVDKATMPLTHGGALVFGGTALWAIVRALDDRRFLWLAGAAAACAQLNRSDGVLWLPTLVVAFLFAPEGSRTPLRALWRAAVGYAVVLGPFLVHNLRAIGEPWPGSLLEATLLTTYPDLYSLPERLTLDRYLAQGAGTILAQKGIAALVNALTFATGLASGGGSDGADKLDTYVPHAMVVVAWIGAAPLFQRRLAVFWAHALLQWTLYSMVFTFTGITSFRPVMYALYPVFLVLAGRGLSILCAFATVRVGERTRTRLRPALLATALLALVGVNAREAIWSSYRRAFANQRGAEFNAELVRKLIRPNGLGGATFLVSQNLVHRFHAQTKLPAASIPFQASEAEIHAAARQVGATYVILEDPAPVALGWLALQQIATSELFEEVAAAAIAGQRRVIYRVVP